MPRIPIAIGTNFLLVYSWQKITKDSIYLYGQHRYIAADFFDTNDKYDLITQYYDGVNFQIIVDV
jgi:hypothetical protein